MICSQVLKVLLPEIEVLSDDKHNTIISGERINLDNVKELTFYRAYKIDGISYPTRQGLYEKDDTLRAVKQHTRYSTHGIHEYKGRRLEFLNEKISSLLRGKDKTAPIVQSLADGRYAICSVILPLPPTSFVRPA